MGPFLFSYLATALLVAGERYQLLNAKITFSEFPGNLASMSSVPVSCKMPRGETNDRTDQLPGL